MSVAENDVVSLAKYNEALEEARKANEAKARAESEVTRLRATYETSIQKAEAARVKAETALADAQLGFAMDRAMLADGISDEGIVEFVRHKFSTLQTEEGKPRPEFGDWWKEYRDSKPAVLTPFLGNPDRGMKADAPPQRPTATKAPAEPQDAAPPTRHRRPPPLAPRRRRWTRPPRGPGPIDASSSPRSPRSSSPRCRRPTPWRTCGSSGGRAGAADPTTDPALSLSRRPGDFHGGAAVANELDYINHGNLFIAAALNQMLYESVVDRTDLRAFCTNYGSVAGTGSIASKVPKASFDDAMSAANSDEVTAVSNVDLGNGTATITVARQALKRTITDPYALVGGPRPGIDRFAADMANAASLRFTDIVAALFTSVTNNVNDTGADLTVDTVSNAHYKLVQATSGGQRNCVMAPIQYTDFLESLRGEGGSAEFSAATEQMLSADPNSVGYGEMGIWRGIRFISCDSVPTSGGDRVGCMFNPKAFGFMEGVPSDVISLAGPGSFASVTPAGSPIFVEFQRLAGEANTIIVGNYYVGASLIDTTHACKLTSSST